MTNRNELGLDTEVIRMTEPREWPNVAARARDDAADYIQMAKARLEHIRKDGGDITRADIALIELDLANALLLLISVGARVRPEGL
jgi:hypothetical protein